ncbi:helix-turn-helix transcriptional regulator [Clostridium perfringens]
MDSREKYKIVGKNIKKIREDKNITQAQLAEILGISVSYISKIEAEKCYKSFSLDLIFRISELLDVNIVEFFKGI